MDTRTVTYEFYQNGTYKRALKLFLNNALGGRDISIGISCERYLLASNNSFNGMFSSKFEDGHLSLYSIFSV